MDLTAPIFPAKARVFLWIPRFFVPNDFQALGQYSKPNILPLAMRREKTTLSPV